MTKYVARNAAFEKGDKLTVSYFSAIGEGGDGGRGAGTVDRCCSREIGLQTNISLFRGVGGGSSVRACQLNVSFS